MSNTNESIYYVYKADLVYVEISSGVYIIGKNKMNRPGGYFTAFDVVSSMNNEELKVAICKGTLENFLHANFKASEAKTNA